MTRPPRPSPLAAMRGTVLALLLGATPLAASGHPPAPATGHDREHLVLDVGDADWAIDYHDDGDTASWHYRPLPGRGEAASIEVFAATATDLRSVPFPAREAPRRMHALLAGYAPDLTLDIRHEEVRDGLYRAVYVLATGRSDDTSVLGLAQESATMLHTVEIELVAGTPDETIAHWVGVLAGAEIRTGVAAPAGGD